MERLGFFHLHLVSASNEARALVETAVGLGYEHFETCQRRFIFIPQFEYEWHRLRLADLFSQQLDYFEDTQALDFFLQTLCGLKSRVIGETEIFGQFRQYVERNELDASVQMAGFASALKSRELIRFLFSTVKEVREKYITKWGVQSYGSLVRKLLRPYSEVSLIGFGHLGQELLPWLKGKQLAVYVRRPNSVNCLLLDDYFPGAHEVRIWSPNDAHELGGAVVVAAPVPCHDLLKVGQRTQLWIDCRALNEDLKSLRGSFLSGGSQPKVVELKDIFLQLEKESEKARLEIPKVLEILADKASRFFMRSSHRPNGWDDLCA